MLRSFVNGSSRQASQLAIRSFSESANSSLNFARDRAKYQQEMSRLRKRYMDEVSNRRDEKERLEAAEKQKVVLKRAIKLREDRKSSVVRQEIAKKARAEALAHYKEHLARNLIIKEERDGEQRERYARAVADLNDESSTWITMDNLEQKITPALFDVPTTTGLRTRHSDNWRYTCTTEELDRLLATGALDNNSDASLTDRLSFRAGYNFVKKSQVADLLNQMIGTGEERAQYKELVNKYVKILTDLDAFHEPKEEFDSLADMLGDNNSFEGADGFATGSDGDDADENDEEVDEEDVIEDDTDVEDRRL